METTADQKEPRANRINILDDVQVSYWTQILSVSETELRNAVFIAGALVDDVKAYLARQEKLISIPRTSD